MIHDAPNINHLWTRLLVEELRRNGVDTFYISPGSRSTPLTLAAAQTEGVQTYVHFDERGAAFAALGHAMGSERPVALICTSGTATANYLPAVVEASQSGIPLIVLTADRPPELTDAGANQAIDQIGLYRNFTRWEHALPCPTTAMPGQALLTAIDQACFRANRNDPGPVHINCPFREPLAPTETGEDWATYLGPLERWLGSDEPYTTYAESKPALTDADAETLRAIVKEAKRGLVIVGRLCRQAEREAARRIVETLQWPTFLDITSGVPFVTEDGTDMSKVRYICNHYDLTLASKRYQAECLPDVVIHLGGPFVSKRLLQQLERAKPQHYVRIAGRPNRDDPAHLTTFRANASLLEAAGVFPSGTVPRDEFSYPRNDNHAAWEDVHFMSSNTASRHLSENKFTVPDGGLDELSAIGALNTIIYEDSFLFLGNSMPVRDADALASFPFYRTVALANRGASGIDGNIATAAGLARGSGNRVTAVIGDVAALHDMNSLALLRDCDPPVTLVVMNNDGGGIFHFLPIAEQEAYFEKYFGTPHGVSFRRAATVFGLDAYKPANMNRFVEFYGEAQQSGRSTVIEVCTERTRNHQNHQAVLKGVCDVVDKEI